MFRPYFEKFNSLSSSMVKSHPFDLNSKLLGALYDVQIKLLKYFADFQVMVCQPISILVLIIA